ncbi:MAG TPA: TonB-dependent receptor [Puia sp.]|jgi:TonB-linked SusC/RagA family outer membrane protein
MKKNNQKEKARSWLSVLLFLLLPVFYGTAQTNGQPPRKITGTIMSGSDRKPMEGVSVVVKGANTGTQTDKNGQFTLNANEKDILILSFIGFATREVPVGKRTTLDIMLESSVTSLDEVVIGYGHAPRRDLTGAISSVSGDDIRASHPSTIDQALQGRVAGVVVQQVSGQPGGGVSVQIRGLSSFSNNPPLYVIDGVIIGGAAIDGSTDGTGSNPLSSINPSEIASIDILKDASATAIYGSQATNGVIVITTKRGRIGAPTVTYDGYYGQQKLPRSYDVMNLRDYATFMNEKSAIIGYDLRPQFANPQYLGNGTNWQKALFRSAPMQNHSVTVSGGDARTQYLLSGTYFDQQGIAAGSDFKRTSVRLNLDNKTTDWLKIGTSLQLANVIEDVNATSSNVIATALTQTPDVNIKNPDGTWGGNDPNIYGAYALNPFALATIIKNQKKRYQLFGNVYAEIAFTPELSLRNEVSGSFDFGTQDQFTPTYTMGPIVNTVNSATYQTAQNFYTTVRSFLTYNHYFNRGYNLNLLLGHEAQVSTFSNNISGRKNFPSNNVQAINSGDATTATNSGDKEQSSQESYFGRVFASYKDKYLLTLNLRDDGSSKFAPANRWVYTYSGAFAWRLSDEAFMKSAITVFDDLKLRLGYGLTNNQNIGNYTYGATLSTVATGLSGFSQLTSNLPNANVKWETTKSFNIGLDASILKKRIEFSIDYYDRTTDGLLLSVPLPLYSGTIPSTGYSPGALAAPNENVGSVRNHGIDLSISSTNITTKDFSWKTNLTVSHNINKVVALNSANDALYGYIGNVIAAKTVVGKPVGEFWGYQSDGIFKNGADFKSHPAIPDNSTTGAALPISPGSGGIWVGDVMWRDKDKNGVIDENDQTFLGSPLPSFQFGFNNTFTYKGFDFTVFFTANTGNKVLNQLNINGTDPNQNFSYFRSVLNYSRIGMIDPNGSTTDVNNFRVTNPNTNIVRISQASGNNNTRISDRYVENGSFLRCKTLALGYSLPVKWISKARLSALHLYANVSNPFIITKYSGMDPEVGSYNPLLVGVDNGFYPQPRVYTVGASLTFSK